MKPVNFVILTTQRSGSTWMVDVLDNCADTAVYGELFLPEKMKWQAGSADFPQFCEARQGIRPFATFAYLNQLYGRDGHTGFKLMYSNLHRYPELLVYLCRHRLRVVHLIRQNLLDVVISSEMASANGQWHRTTTESVSKVTQVYLEPQALLARMRRLQKKVSLARKWLRWYHLPHLEVHYETLLANPAHFAQTTHFLGLSQLEGNTQSSFSKIRQSSYADEISNYDEVKATLMGTEFARLLN